MDTLETDDMTFHSKLFLDVLDEESNQQYSMDHKNEDSIFSTNISLSTPTNNSIVNCLMTNFNDFMTDETNNLLLDDNSHDDSGYEIDQEDSCLMVDDICVKCHHSNCDDAFVDTRDEIHILRDIIGTLNYYYEDEFRHIINLSISREASEPEIKNEIYRSKSDIRAVCKKWRSDQKSKALQDIQSDTYINTEYKNYVSKLWHIRNIKAENVNTFGALICLDLYFYEVRKKALSMP